MNIFSKAAAADQLDPLQLRGIPVIDTRYAGLAVDLAEHDRVDRDRYNASVGNFSAEDSEVWSRGKRMPKMELGTPNPFARDQASVFATQPRPDVLPGAYQTVSPVEQKARAARRKHFVSEMQQLERDRREAWTAAMADVTPRVEALYAPLTAERDALLEQLRRVDAKIAALDATHSAVVGSRAIGALAIDALTPSRDTRAA